MTEAEPSYISRFNAVAHTKGTSCGVEAIRELNDTLKHPVAVALRKVMHLRPTNPITYLAGSLKLDNEAKYTVDRKTLVVEELHNVEVQMQRASQRPAGCLVQKSSRYALTGIQCPSFQELAKEIERVSMENADCTQISVVVKENDPRKDLVFVQGIPYFTEFTAVIMSANLEMKKKDTPQHLLLKSAGKLGKAHTIKDIVSAAKVMKKPVHYSFIQSPQTSSFQAIDLIDSLVGLPKASKDTDSGGKDAAARPLQPIIIVSYHADVNVLRQLMTIAITASHPTVELEDMKDMLALRESSLLARRKQCFSEHVDYWKKVRVNREARDQKRADKEELRLRKEATLMTGIVNSDQPGQANVVKSESADITSGGKKAALERYHRRQREDGLFLDVCRWHRDQSATRIQNMWRGAKSRNMWKAAAKNSKAQAAQAGLKAPDSGEEEIVPPKRLKSLTNIDAPVLMQRAMRCLQDTHGEKFVNSIQLVKKGFVRSIPLWIPKRKKLKKLHEDDESSEEESWEKFEVELPNIPSSKRSKDFNPFSIMRSAAKIAGYDGLENATFDGTNFPGLSAMQQRAYSTVMDNVVLMVHSAFIELRHRGQALGDSSFSKYFRRNFFELQAWRAVPNFVALATAELTGVPLRSGPADPLRDRFLCLSDMPTRPPWHQFSATRDTLPDACWVKEVAKHVFAALDAPDTARFKNMMLAVQSGSSAHVTWISTTSQPFAYVHGKTFVACERRRDQITPGHEVPHRIADIARRSQVHDGATPNDGDARSRTPSVCNSVSPSPAPAAIVQPQASGLAPFGVSMCEFEQRLRSELIHVAESKGALRFLDIAAEKSSPSKPAASALDMLDLTLSYGHYFVDIMQAPMLENREFVLFPKVAKEAEEVGSGNDLVKDNRRTSSQNNQNAMLSEGRNLSSSRNIKSRRQSSRPSESDRSGSALGSRDMGDGKSPSTSSLVPLNGDTSGVHQPFQSAARSIIQTPSAVADTIIQEDARGNATFIRMPMMDMGGLMWLRCLDHFLAECFACIRKKDALVVAVCDESSMFYACCAALLGTPLTSGAGGSASSVSVSGAVLFDDDLIANFIEALGEESGERAKSVVDEVLLQSFNGETFTMAIMHWREAAAQAHTHKNVRDNIVLASQRLERYCWLIMLASFVMTLVPGATELPSFSQWATSKKNSAAWKALDRLELWPVSFTDFPDHCHYAYASFDRRWDSKAEAKQML